MLVSVTGIVSNEYALMSVRIVCSKESLCFGSIGRHLASRVLLSCVIVVCALEVCRAMRNIFHRCFYNSGRCRISLLQKANCRIVHRKSGIVETYSCTKNFTEFREK